MFSQASVCPRGGGAGMANGDVCDERRECVAKRGVHGEGGVNGEAGHAWQER